MTGGVKQFDRISHQEARMHSLMRDAGGAGIPRAWFSGRWHCRTYEVRCSDRR